MKCNVIIVLLLMLRKLEDEHEKPEIKFMILFGCRRNFIFTIWWNFQMGAECTRNILICFLWLVKNTERPQLKSWWLSIPSTHLIGILDLLYISISCFEYGVKVNILIWKKLQRTFLASSVFFSLNN